MREKRPKDRPPKKTAILAVRVSPGLKLAVTLAARKDHRSVTGLIETLIINHCKRNKISIAQPEGREEIQ